MIPRSPHNRMITPDALENRDPDIVVVERPPLPPIGESEIEEPTEADSDEDDE